MKLDEARKDYYRRLAKSRGFKSRSAFKLLQLNHKFHVLKLGDIAVDFGCAPGGWLQVASKAVGKHGSVLGIDIKDVEYIANNVDTFVYDVTRDDITQQLQAHLPSRVDTVLSDMSPNISGIWELDNLKQIELTFRVLSLLPQILKVNGIAVLKAFEGRELSSLIQKLKKLFNTTSIERPSATRAKSSEIYLICQGYALYSSIVG